MAGYLNLCKACGEDFNSVGAFDAHRTGKFTDNTRRCLTPDEMRDRDMTRNARGRWITEVYTQHPAASETAQTT